MELPFKEQTWNWEINVQSAERSGYLEVPFDLPAAAERLHVTYTYEGLGEGACIIDLGLRDDSRVRGWSGGARKEFYVAETEATPGYMPGRLQAGTWAVLLGAYRVPAAGCVVRGTVTVRTGSGCWLKGDLHSHTVHSDGAYTLEEAVQIMREAECDFLATTDHNTVSQNFAHPAGSELVLIPGMELTTNSGHSNMLGVMEPVRDFRVSNREEAEERLREARRNGAVRVRNHPFCDNCPWEWGMDMEAEAVEIWNGPWRTVNQRALDWWQQQLVSGRRIPAVGGSDVHRPHPHVRHAWPSTWVHAQARTKEAILEGIASGHVFISFAPHGPVLELLCGSYGIGDTVPSGESGTVLVKLDRLLPGDRIRFITNRGQAEERTVPGAGDTTPANSSSEPKLGGTWTGRWTTQRDDRFMRIEVWRYFAEADALCPALLSNPIYFS